MQEESADIQQPKSIKCKDFNATSTIQTSIKYCMLKATSSLDLKHITCKQQQLPVQYFSSFS